MVQQETFFNLSIDWITNLLQEMQGYQLQRFLSISTKNLDCTVEFLLLGGLLHSGFWMSGIIKKIQGS